MGQTFLAVEKKEYMLVKRTINLSAFIKDRKLQEILSNLYQTLENARICSEGEMPKNVVRINSIVTIVSTSGAVESFQLVLPSDIGTKENKVSVFTEKGASVFGRKEGNRIDPKCASPSNTYTIARVRQQNKNIGLDMVL